MKEEVKDSALEAVASSSPPGDPSTATLPAPDNDRLERWQKRWSEGKTQWHSEKVHASLALYLEDKLILPSLAQGKKNLGIRMLVPLCGKSVDMNYLATKREVSEVVGVDGVRAAAKDFSIDHPGLNMCQSSESVGGFEHWTGESTTFLVGDFFDLDAKSTGGGFDAVWDRAALVAVHPSLREQYMKKLGELVKQDGQASILLSTYVRPNGDVTSGPPYSIDEYEVRKLFEGQEWVESIELLDSHSAASTQTWYQAIFFYLRLGNLQELIFLIKTKKK